ncbi:MAG: hypothetical protein K8T89_27060 [Planctomycetes bacterium]|nr:hypothetical protein [Planctomycetota bacterium]
MRSTFPLYRYFVPAMMALVLIGTGLAAAEAPLSQRIRDNHFWSKYGRDGKTMYFMVAQPAHSEAEQAKALGVPANAPDGGRLILGKPIEFRAADDTGGIDIFGPGLHKRRVENNALAFEVGEKDAYFAWGNFDGKHANLGYKPFGVAHEWQRHGKWYTNTFFTGEPFGIYLRVRQSAKESTWKVVIGANPELNDVKPKAAPGGWTAEFKLIGTNWQTVPIIYGDKVKDPQGKPGQLPPFGSLAIYPGNPGNQIEIEWIRITDPRWQVYARRTVDLPAAPKDAAFNLSTWDSEVYVNGQRVVDRGFPLSSMGHRAVNLAPLLKAGRNVVALHSWNSYGELTTTGGITCVDGTFVPLSSWLPMKRTTGKWARDETVQHFSLSNDFAAPWKTASLAFKPDDTTRFMAPDYDDGDWNGLTALETSGTAAGAGPPYFGLIAVELPSPEKLVYRGAARPRQHPIFSVREPVRFTIQALRFRKEAPRYRLAYTLTDKQTGKLMETGSLPLDAKNSVPFERKNLSMGAYELHLTLTDADQRVDERAYEFLVIGPIQQPVVTGTDVLEGLKLTEVVDIDCAAAPKDGEYGAFRGWEGKGVPYEAKVLTAPFGKFRETGEQNGDCFSYKVAVQHPGRPHVLEVTYPDDRFRVSGFFYTELGDMQNGSVPGTNRCSIGVISGWPETPTQTLKKTHGLFWPVSPTGTVDIYTTRYSPKYPSAPAAAARIRIFEVDGELPRLAVHDYPGQFKPIGNHTERGPNVLWPTYYGGRNNPFTAAFHCLHDRPDFYADWFSVSSNFVRGLRFHGLNCYFAGQHMYGGTNFPSTFNDNDNGSGGFAIQSQKDWAGILASVMGENDCGLVSSFEYINNSTIIARGSPSPAQLARGIPTLVQVSHQGKAYPYGSGIYIPSPLPSYAHPEVERMLLAEIDELIELNKEYPGWKGIQFLLNTLCGPSYGEVGGDGLKMGYEDVAAERFEKETGKKFPVPAGDPERFRKRYEAVMADAALRDAWVQWRCDVLLAINRKIRDRLLAVRPDCKLYLNMAYPYKNTDEKLEYGRDPEKLRRYVMQWGWDPRAYQKESAIVVSTMAHADAEKRLAMTGEPEKFPLARAQGYHRNYLNLFANDGRGGIDLHNIFTENWPSAEKGKWLWQSNGAWVTYHAPTGAAFNDAWTRGLIRTNPTTVAFNWHDSNLDSRMEPGLRRFVQTWRPLPNGRYESMTGNGLDHNVVIQKCVEKPEYHYIANPCSWSIETTLTFAAGSRVTDLHRNSAIVLDKEQTWKVSLAPYATQSFRVQNSGVGFLRAASAVEPAVVERLRARVKSEEDLAERLRKEGDGPKVAAFAAQVKRLTTAFGRQDYLGAEALLREDYEFYLARTQAQGKK